MNSSKLSVSTTVIDAATLVRVEGIIDESTDTRMLLPSGAEVVIYDLDGVKRITSYGVLQWVKALKDLRARYYGFMRCRPCIVRQFNMVAGFGKQGEVLSVYLPYFCEGCDAEFETLLDLRADFVIAQTASPPEVRCPKCGKTAVWYTNKREQPSRPAYRASTWVMRTASSLGLERRRRSSAHAPIGGRTQRHWITTPGAPATAATHRSPVLNMRIWIASAPSAGSTSE